MDPAPNGCTTASHNARPRDGSSVRTALSDSADDYITRTLNSRDILPPVTWKNWHKNIFWPHFLVFLGTHGLTLLGPIFVPWRWSTVLFSICYGHFLALGITAGYHRLWSHNSYNGSNALQYFLAIIGAGTGQRDIEWWCIRHRAHHRYTDTPLDPYNAKMGFFWSHLGWVIFKPRCEVGFVDISDLKKNSVVQWQKKNYLLLVVLMKFIVPVAIPWLFCDDSLRSCIVWGFGVRTSVFYHVSLQVFFKDVDHAHDRSLVPR
jgi:stearoyl-CoA desaturase (delta-9 desaturase)